MPASKKSGKGSKVSSIKVSSKKVASKKVASKKPSAASRKPSAAGKEEEKFKIYKLKNMVDELYYQRDRTHVKIYINGQYADKATYTWTPSDMISQTIIFNTATLGYTIDPQDIIIVKGRWA